MGQSGTPPALRAGFLRDFPVQKSKGSNLWFESPGRSVFLFMNNLNKVCRNIDVKIFMFAEFPYCFCVFVANTFQ